MKTSHRLVLIIAVLSFVLLLPEAFAAKRSRDEARGQQLYERHCLACHGATGGGDGPAASSLSVAVPDLRGKIQNPEHDKWLGVILEGRGLMPSYELSIDVHDAKRVMRHMHAVGGAL